MALYGDRDGMLEAMVDFHLVTKWKTAGDSLLAVAEEVYSRGWKTIKLYFMIGLPGETVEDVQAIADLARLLHPELAP